MTGLSYHFENLLASSVGREHGLRDDEFEHALARAASFTRRLQGKESASRPGFLDLPGERTAVDAIRAFASRRRGAFETLLLLGIGGSSLGAVALYDALRPVEKTPRRPAFRVIDNSDPSTAAFALAGLDPAMTLTLAVSKSGGTVETVAALALVDDWYKRAGLNLDRHVAVVSGAKGGFLNAYAERNHLERLILPDNVGGRFSVLSAPGLAPAALLGFDPDALLSGARDGRDAWLGAPGPGNWPMVAAAAHTMLLASRGKTTAVLMPYASRLARLGEWFVQLWDESLGKARDLQGKPCACGQTALVAVGASAQHSQLQLFLEGPNDKVVTFMKLLNFETVIGMPDGFDYAGADMAYLKGKSLTDLVNAELDGTQGALTEQHRPNARIEIERLDEQTMGALFMFFELQTAYGGFYLNVDAYDQPGVERAKQIARTALEGPARR